MLFWFEFGEGSFTLFDMIEEFFSKHFELAISITNIFDDAEHRWE